MGSATRAAGLLAAAAVLLFTGLGLADLFNPDEPREAEIAREMWASGDRLVPRLNAEPFLEKPPLFYWLVVAAYGAGGGPGEVTARMTPAVAGLLCVLLTYLFGRGMVGERGAVLGALILLTAVQFFWISRRCMIDMPLACAVLVACGAFHRAVVLERRFRFGWLLLGYFATGAAVMFKGIVGAGIPALALLGTIVARRDWRGIWRHGLIPGAAIVLLPVTIWVLRLHERLGDEAVHHFVWVNNVLRFAGGAGRGHERVLLYYLPVTLMEFAPWSLLLPFALAAAFSAARARRAGSERGSLVYLLCWFVLPFVVLSLAATKRGIYLLPIFPPAALLVGWWLVRAEWKDPAAATRVPPERPRLPRIVTAILLGVTIAMCAVAITGLQLVRPAYRFGPLAAAVLLVPLGVMAYRSLRRGRTIRMGMTIACMLGFLYLAITILGVPVAVNGRASDRAAAEQLRRLVGGGDRIALYRFKEGMLGGYLFYSGHTYPNLSRLDQLRDHLGMKVDRLPGPRRFALMREEAYLEVATELEFPTRIVPEFESASSTHTRSGGRNVLLIERRQDPLQPAAIAAPGPSDGA